MSQPYLHTDDVHNMDSPREVMPVIMKLTGASSVIDVGCGTGTWLKAFEEAGVKDYLGVDGDYVQRSQMKIPIEKFLAKDLTTSWQPDRKFDLAISLEVAEHLPAEKASTFVKTLVQCADQIIFSAAIPGQGGQNHLNEQWPDYWQEKFREHGFYFHDVIRPLIWDNPKVQWWYRQNIFLLKKERSSEPIRHYVHPEAHITSHKNFHSEREAILSGSHGPLRSFKIFIKSIFKKPE